jgi:hypothetical protein
MDMQNLLADFVEPYWEYHKSSPDQAIQTSSADA